MAPYSTVVPALVGLATASSSGIQNAVTPVDKVITLMQELKAECEAEASAEATTYDTFACFCKDTTEAKSDSIIEGSDTIAEDSADLAASTASKEEKEEELQTRKKKQEELSTELAENKARCQKEEAEYDAEAADLNKGISSLEKAIQAMEDGKPAALIELGSSVKKTLAMADALNLLESKKQQKVAAFLQVDPNDPEYKHHSQGIIDIMNQVLQDFQSSKADLDAEWTKTDINCQSTISDLTSQMTENSNAMELCEETIAELTTEIAEIREDIVGAQAALEDNKAYMKDLTERCEARAKDYDQRSAMRGQEIDALSKALEILVGEVKGKSDAVNERALLQQPGQWKKRAARTSTVSDVAESLSFLQQSSSATARNLAKTFLQRSQSGLTDAARRDKVLVLLKTEGQRLSSTALNSLAMKVAADPFLKVKQLIQKLIERLLSEAAAEATKKGFCDNELSKARKDRDFRFAEVKKLSSDIRGLNAKKDELESELEQLGASLKDLEASLAEATKIRGEEKEENLQTMKDARQGLTALTQAIQILKIFYKQSAKAKVFIQASPLEEDDPGAAKGAYKGNQGASKAILGLLEVLQSDFQRTLSTTEAAEKKAQAEFVEFDRTSKADIGAKQTKSELSTEDLSTTEINLEKSMKSLQENQDATDQATKELEELKPMCIDTGMSYEERVEKREQEIAALKNAVCMLDPEGVEPDCPV